MHVNKTKFQSNSCLDAMEVSNAGKDRSVSIKIHRPRRSGNNPDIKSGDPARDNQGRKSAA